MPLRSALAALASCTLVACAAGTSDDPAGVADDAGAVGATSDGGTEDGAAGPTGSTGPGGPTGATGPGVIDAGPPATVGGDDAGEVDAGPDTGTLPNGECATLAQCPYSSATNVSTVACEDAGGTGTCVITCNGENYDVDGLLADGCEVPQTCPVGNGTMICPIDDHTEATAANLGSFDCNDTDSAQNLTGNLPSDDRAHSPAVDGFVVATGSAPGYFTLVGTDSGICENDANFALQMTLSPSGTTKQAACYVLSLLTDNEGLQTCTTDVSGNCTISNGSGSYGDGSTLYVWISKNPACSAADTPDDGQFVITGHL